MLLCWKGREKREGKLRREEKGSERKSEGRGRNERKVERGKKEWEEGKDSVE